MKKLTTHKLTVLSLCLAASMILSYVESLVPLPVAGVKLGLPNIFIIYILYTFDFPYAAAVSVLRCVLTSLLFGSVMSLWYSLAGAIVSILIMVLLKKLGFFSPLGVSIAGGVCHNGAQICVAILVTGVNQIVWYLPILFVTGAVAGVLVGIAADQMIKRLKFKL